MKIIEQQAKELKEKIHELVWLEVDIDNESLYIDNIADQVYELFISYYEQASKRLLRDFYAYVNDEWALGMLTDKVDEVIKGFKKKLTI
jgi:hypothetical protein